jgi:hypothetical protein
MSQQQWRGSVVLILAAAFAEVQSGALGAVNVMNVDDGDSTYCTVSYRVVWIGRRKQ